jgi:hypothetical protein
VVSPGTLVPQIYQTATAGTSVLRYTPKTGGGQVPFVNVATGCTSAVVGVAVVGQSLFAGCSGSGNSSSTIVQVDKTSSTFVRSFGNSNSKPAGFGLDPITLGPKFKELLWTKQQTSIALEGIEIPGGTSGQIVGAAVAFPAACPPTYPTQPDGSPLDSDGDSLLNCWEDGTLWSDGLPGISFTGGWVAIPRPASERDLTLCIDAAGDNVSSLPQGADFATFLAARCVSTAQRDILLELDWMADALAGHTHDPRVSAPDAVPHVIAAFANAPTPIKLLVEFSNPIPHTDSTALTPCTAPPGASDASFDQLKATHFGKPNESNNKVNARHFTSHYALLVHYQSGSTSTGCAEVRGNDLMVSLGAWGTFTFANNVIHGVGTPEQQEGTLMHELGHNLGLLHGGFEHVNCKPNYVSVMSYSRQFPRPPAQDCPACTGFPLDYSRAKLPDLNENSLSEGNSPLGLFAGDIIFGPPVVQQSGQPAKPVVVNVVASGGVDWNRSGSAVDAGVSRDLTSLTSLGCSALPLQTLVSFDDWSNLHFNFRASVDFALGASSTHTEDKKKGNKEIEIDEALELTPYLIDLKPADQNNTINRNSKQNLNVSILSQPGDVTGAGFFDATTVDPATVTLRGKFPFTWVVGVDKTQQGGFQCKAIDTDGDHIADFVCAFTIPSRTLSNAETAVILEGRTFAGEPVLASDFIQVQ